MQADVAGKSDMYVPRLLFAPPLVAAGVLERHAAQYRHPVIRLLPVDRLMDIAEIVKDRAGKQLVRDLDFLQAEDVGSFFGEEARDQFGAQADGINVPSGNAKRHGESNKPVKDP